MNKCMMTGNLCKEVEVKIIQGTDKKVIQNSIAVKRNFKNKQGEYDSDFINLIIYEPHANFVEQYISKGDKVAVSGRWQHRKYENSTGTHYVDELVVDGIELLAKPQQVKQEQPTLTGRSSFVESDFDKPSFKPSDIDPDELPFY